MTAWLDRIAADLLHVEQDLRTTLRSLSRGGAPARLAGWNRLVITPAEARTLLRGAMPAPIATTRLRTPHARLVAAMSVLSGHLVALNDPLHRPEAAIGAAVQLADELKRWTYVARWGAACRLARVRLRVPGEPAVTTVMQPGSAADREQLPNAWAGEAQLRTDSPAARPLPHQLRQLRAEQLALDLAPPAPGAEVIDLRQMRLQLAPPTQETDDAHRQATA